MTGAAGQDPPHLRAGDAHWLPTWRAAYSDRTAWLMSVFSQLAYVPFKDDQPNPGKDQPKRLEGEGFADLDPYLSPGGFEVRATFNKGNVQTFLAVNPDELAVLSFRGTANWKDWEIDLNAVRIPMPGYEAVDVHSGFWNAYRDSADDILAAVNEHVGPDLGLYITGHSLGGALAQIAAAKLERDNLAACYTFGSPRVATAKFDRYVKCPHYRLVNHWDLVPGVPLPMLLWGYRHTGDPRLLDGVDPTEVERRDHSPIARFGLDLLSAARWLFTHDFSAVDDHMIWNYRIQLERIAMARTAGAPGTPTIAAP
jgi:pimeloyl-ACP methyl ester carboxylesterase